MKLPVFIKIVMAGFLLGVLVHFTLISLSYFNLKSKIRQSKFTEIIFNRDPSFGSKRFVAKDHNTANRKIDDKLPWRMFVNMGILSWETTTDNVSAQMQQAIIAEKETFQTTTTIQHLIRVSEMVGSKNQAQEFKDNLENLIAACLAGGPNAFKVYGDAVGSSIDKLPDYHENFLSFLFPKQLGGLWGKASDQSEIVNLLFLNSRIAEKYDNLPLGDPDGKGITPVESYRQVSEYFQRMLVSIHDDPKVSSAKNWFTVLEGPEQFFMYIVFCIGLLLLIQNMKIIRSNPAAAQYKASLTNINKSEPSLTNVEKYSLILYRWVLIALPSLGFIGTKRGLSEALGKADTIVRANTQINQALAVSSVSETMGVAFTSTLVGLILLMLLLTTELILKYKNVTWNES
ncbi:hypothetical protein QWZ08_04445 [Ferruginibacter paludis]|uniref:hypothetical protein n=1 Tax=Ferruginibacter paludis TaxID=1310417 RepID=UPI0025B4E51E|nr:hypothetical protein [Ferruginibacter paludis]MDN3654865.1 hypothetical protein [Ferruginibacter paludis]